MMTRRTLPSRHALPIGLLLLANILISGAPWFTHIFAGISDYANWFGKGDIVIGGFAVLGAITVVVGIGLLIRYKPGLLGACLLLAGIATTLIFAFFFLLGEGCYVYQQCI
jgi:hypothetical protein